ncbi:MAG TPA: GEVED domain-containing protein, partial [Bacteroidales bacterium]|nr:GEVED domain-containing protein [Bacteroidales bacterium]HSA44039.1 GEVED domain-containing protein [Bacteroidales bacterium]
MKKFFFIMLACMTMSSLALSQQLYMHFAQTPDITPTGIDIHSRIPLQVADDWQATATGPVTEITIWGGWLYDVYGQAAIFTLEIYSDVPAIGGSPSHPGNLLWQHTFNPGTYPAPGATMTQGEYYYNPLTQFLIFPGNMMVWAYVFPISQAQAFMQTAGSIYWLCLTVNTSDDLFSFGWKSSLDHWNDKAVWKQQGGNIWTPLVYPPTHPMMGQPVDLAFLIKGPPTTQACCFPDGNCSDLDPTACQTQGGTPMGPGTNCNLIICPTTEYDYGDAPDPSYPTLAASDGARHLLVPNMKLGPQIDVESDGYPSTGANGDDLNNLDDEDGVVIHWGGSAASPMNIRVAASTAGFLNAWTDFNNDGDWDDANEQIFNATPLVPGANFLSFLIPANADTNGMYTRFRFSSQPLLSYTGQAQDGEVEDYKLPIHQDTSLKWSQACATTLPGLHAHDAIVAQSHVKIYLADDWLCSGGEVTTIKWYGAYENQGAGIQAFNLRIYADQAGACIPGLPALVDITVPLSGLNETNTTMTTSDGLLIYEYTCTLSDPFLQQAGLRYWLALSALSVNPVMPAVWRWCEAARSHVPALCPTAQMTITDGVPGPWTPLQPWTNTYSEMAFSIISQPAPPELPSDMFIKAGDWVVAEPWHNWIGGTGEDIHVCLFVKDPDYMIGQVIFYYSTDLSNWSYIGTDQDGHQLSTWNQADQVQDPGDGWSAYLPAILPFQVVTPLYFKAEILLNNDEILEYIRTEPVNYDPSPPSSVTCNINDWYTTVTGSISVDVDPVWADIAYIIVGIEPKTDDFNKGIPNEEQQNPNFEHGGNFHCAPTAATACLKYFSQHGDPGIMGGLNDEQMIQNLATMAYTNQYPDTGTYTINLANALKSWLANNGNGYSVRFINYWQQNAQGGWDNTFSNADWQFMRNELERCQDVLTDIAWLNDNNEVTGAHEVTFNSVYNIPSAEGLMEVDFMDPWTGEQETGFLDPATGILTGYADNQGDDPPYGNEKGRIGDLIVVCPFEGSVAQGPGTIAPGPNPPPIDVLPPDTGRWFVRIKIVDMSNFAYRYDYVVNRLAADFGDAPDTYTTLYASGGPYHMMPSNLWLGDSIDYDIDGMPGANCLGDDNNLTDDEDGVNVPHNLSRGNPGFFFVKASAAGGYLNTWVDYNHDGDFGDPDEQVFTNLPLHAGVNKLGFLVPGNAMTGATAARFRLSSQAGISFGGPAPDGEVEDHMIEISPAPGGYKWIQPPDPFQSGLHAHDYQSSQVYEEYVVADDWICMGGVITDIHWKGNYEIDGQGNEIRGSGIDHFKVRFYMSPAGGCLPATSPFITWTIPFSASVETASGIMNNEGCMIYDYLYYLTEPFQQETGTHYWISITAYALNPSAPPRWRWQESYRTEAPVLCAAVTRTIQNNIPSPWNPLSWQGSIFGNMAFELTNQIPMLDYGDAPDPAYPTTLVSNGARHDTITLHPYMGLLKDLEANGLQNATASGDDLNNTDDEDGVVFTTDLIPGQNAGITVTASIANALLQGWIDFNADGDWSDAGEQIITNLATSPGPNNITFGVPANAATDTTFARFRISTQPNLSFTGYASNGEVEDYLVEIIQPLDFGDAPDPSYPTLLASNGARHVISGLKLGNLIDGETDGQPNNGATGDDNSNLPDEDGVTLLWGMNIGSPTAITVNASAACMLDAWADFNADGDWSDAGEQIFASRPLIAGNNILNFIVPAGAVSDVSYFRYRVTSNGGLSFNGPAAEGEVEDYSDSLRNNPGYKWIQPPHPSFAALHCHDGMSGGQLQHIVGADDWLCNGGIVTDIHWYGTYENQGSGIHYFHLAIFANDSANCIPAGPEIWSADVPLAQANQLATGMINSQGELIYSYAYDLSEPFQQQQGNRYWLAITSVSYNPNNPTMWKWSEATRNHLPALCPAVYRTVTGGQQGNWTPYIWQGNLHTDFAFKITNQPASIDFGDAPDPSYPTLLASNGARHGNNVPGVFLGALKDMEFNGQPSAGANGDDNNGVPDDEDGVIFAGPAIAGQPLNITVTASIGNCPLNAWMDFNCDGDWRDAGEKVFNNLILAAGPNALVINIPPTAVTDTTYLRFRYSTMGNLADTAAAPNGEVEDYMLVIQPDSLDYGDAPDPSYPTLLAS